MEMKERWNKINRKYYLSLAQIPDDELFEATLDILKFNVCEKNITITIVHKLASRDGSLVIEEGVSEHYVLEGIIPYNKF